MVTFGDAYVLFVAAAALVALAAAIPVLLRIAVDGRERLQREQGADDGESVDAAQTEPARSRCPYCGAENDDGYTYCRECLEQL